MFKTMGKMVKFLANFPRWMGYSELKDHGKRIKDLFSFLAKKRTPGEQAESFEEAVARMGLSESDIQTRQRSFLNFTFIYLVISLLLLAIALYLMIQVRFIDGAVALLVSMIGFTLTFREHFYYFQMKQRKLGCTFKAWLAFCLGGFRK